MPQFYYEGKNAEGKPVTGTIAAATDANASAQLRRENIRLTELREKRQSFSFSFGNAVKLRDVSAFTRQLASMNSSAIPLVQSLEAIVTQTENKTLRNAVQKISSDVQAGISLAAAMMCYPRIFNKLYCAMVKAGESAGILSNVLERLADYQEKAVAIEQKVKSAFAYPIIVGTVAVGAMIALMTFVVPTFSSMLNELGADLPLVTRIVIQASEIIKVWALPAIGTIAASIITFRLLYRRKESVREWVDGISLRIPLFGDLQKKNAISRFSRTFGSLLSGGVPITEALGITSVTAGNLVLEKAFQKTLKAIQEGRTLAQPLNETGIFPAMVIQMVEVGERSGNLPEMLRKIADYYDTEVETATSTLTSVLEPVLIVGMGIFIAAVLISMYLPMFEMVGAIG